MKRLTNMSHDKYNEMQRGLATFNLAMIVFYALSEYYGFDTLHTILRYVVTGTLTLVGFSVIGDLLFAIRAIVRFVCNRLTK